MASDVPERRAALRDLLIEQVEATVPPRPARAVTSTRAADPGRLRMALVTGAVAVAVVAATVVALQLSQQHGGGVAAPATGSTPSAVPTTTAPSSAAPTPTSTPTLALIAPTGWHQLTRAELHAWVTTSPIFQDDAANATIWEGEAWLDIRCMASKGYVYDPIAEHAERSGNTPGLTTAQAAEYQVLYYGPQSDAAYDWRTAGCHGRSVHLMGQDDAH